MRSITMKVNHVAATAVRGAKHLAAHSLGRRGHAGPLWRSATVVNRRNPLTSAQAREVVAAGSALTASLVAHLERAGFHIATFLDGEARAIETWSPCRSFTQLRWNASNRGQYATRVWMDSETAIMPAELAGTATAMPGVTWAPTTLVTRTLRGRAGLFSVHVEIWNPNHVVLTVQSPCYFIDKLNSSNVAGGALQAELLEDATGFRTRPWASPAN